MRLGSDPEVFLINNAGKHISSIGFINANKWNPLQIPDMAKGFTLQEDNVSLEYGIPPAATVEEFAEYIEKVMQKSLEYVPNLGFSKLSCTIFDPDQMEHPDAHVFGCEPDYCAWTQDYNPAPRPPHPFMRSAGGHIHVETDLNPWTVVKNMDKYLGVPSVLMDKGEDRKQLYGKAGACRIKPYGVEYRTLSNFWIFDRKLIEWVWRSTARALADSVNDDVDQHKDLILECINNNNKQLAESLCNELRLEVV